MSVYAIEDGTIYTGNKWGNNNVGQVLINHTTNGDKWSTGYLHMKNIVKKSGDVKKGDLIGYISDVGTPGSIHLHFAVYNSHGRRSLHSVNVDIQETSYPLNRLEILDFLQSSSNFTYLQSCSGEEHNISAEFKANNIGSGSIYIDKMALAVYINDTYSFDMGLWEEGALLNGNSYLHLYGNSAAIMDIGEYKLVAKVDYDGSWHHIGTQDFSVTANDSCGNQSTGNNKTTWVTGDYGNNEHRSENLFISGANSLTVTVSGETESGWDFIYIFDENNNQVKKLDGSINTSFTVSGSSITAELTSDRSVTRSGVTVTIVDGNETATETETEDNTQEGDADIEGFYNQYPDYFGSKIGGNYHCSGQYTCQDFEGGKKIAVHNQSRLLYYYDSSQWNRFS